MRLEIYPDATRGNSRLMLRKTTSVLRNALTLVACIFLFGQPADASDFDGCYDVAEIPQSYTKWEAIRVTDELVDFQGNRWRRLISLNPDHSALQRFLWRDDDPRGVIIYFGSEHPIAAHAGSSAALLHETSYGYRGNLRVTGGYATTTNSDIELRRRPCGSKTDSSDFR